MVKDSRQLTVAEDALSEALLSALRDWPEKGIPERPEAWLLAVARRRTKDHGRDFWRELQWPEDYDPADFVTNSIDPIPDERLKLLYLSCHPALDPAVRTPLLLNLALGFTAEQISQLFLVPAKTMSQRLVRAKSRIRDVGFSTDIPDRESRFQRLPFLHDALYGAFFLGWETGPMLIDLPWDLAEEAIMLTRALLELGESTNETHALLALMLYLDARREARRRDGEFIPLSDQDPSQWDLTKIQEAERHLFTASREASLGRYQIEAAIQSVHCNRLHSGETDWPMLVELYDLLLSRAPSIGAALARIQVISEIYGAEFALEELDQFHEGQLEEFLPYHALRADLLWKVGEYEAAAKSYLAAESLVPDAAVASYFHEKRMLALAVQGQD